MAVRAYGIEVGAVYTVVGPDGTRAVFNAPSDPDHVGYLVGDDAVTGLERAGVRESAEVLPEADGGIHGVFRRDRLPFTLKGLIDLSVEPSGITRQSKLLRAVNALAADAVLKWAPSTIPAGVQLAFREQQPTRITGRRPKSFLIAGVSEDPYVVGQALNEVQIVPALTPAGGFASPLTSPLTSSPGSSGTVQIDHEGTGRAWPLIQFWGPATNPSLTNQATGETIYLTYALGAGEYLEVDTHPRRRSVTLNGTAGRYSAYDYSRSRWWGLLPGINNLSAGYSSVGAGALVVVRYRHTWG